MYKRKKSAMIRLVALVIVIALLVPMGANAATMPTVQPYASYYLDSYSAYVYLTGDGEVQVWFNVYGTGTMDEIGALSIKIYECATNSSNLDDWEWKKTFTHDSTSGMLGYDDYSHCGHVSYDGTAGKYYKAYVCVWGGKNGDGDTRYFWTSAKK